MDSKPVDQEKAQLKKGIQDRDNELKTLEDDIDSLVAQLKQAKKMIEIKEEIIEWNAKELQKVNQEFISYKNKDTYTEVTQEEVLEDLESQFKRGEVNQIHNASKEVVDYLKKEIDVNPPKHNLIFGDRII